MAGLPGWVSGVFEAVVLVGRLVGQHVPDRSEHRVLDRDQCAHGSSSGGEFPVAGLEEGTVCSAGGHRCDAESASEIGVPGSCFP